MFPLILLQAKAGGEEDEIKNSLHGVSINSPSGEGGGCRGGICRVFSHKSRFPLILLQAKAGGITHMIHSLRKRKVSINSPSGEGGGTEALLTS